MKVWGRFARVFVAMTLVAGAQMFALPAANAADGTADATPTPTAPSTEAPAPETTAPETPSSSTPSTEAPSVETPAAAAPAAPMPRLRAAAVTPLAAGNFPVCGQGYAYSVTSAGTVLQYSPTGSPAMSTFGNWSGVSNVNGLAITADGSAIYAYVRSADSLGVSAMLRYTAATNTWEQIPNSSFNRFSGSALVAGSMNLSNGRFVFGGFNGSTFQIYEYNPATNTYRTLGYINTVSGQSNGDLAFDSAGNLYIVGSASSTSIYTVTAQTLANANGGQLARSETNSATISLNSVNGIAFRPDGLVYLSNGSSIARFDPTTWAQVGSTVSLGTTSSTDLASCDSPVNLTVQKSVTGRANPTDQFRLAVNSGTTEVSSATTSGTATGIQAQQIGPIPVVQNRTYRISETASSGSLSDYSTSYVCTSGGTTVASGSGASGDITIPNAPGATVNCVFTNTPLLATVTVNKTVLDINGQNPQPGSGWTLGAATTATTGTATSTPTATTQTADAAGNARWTVRLGSADARATVTVSETMKSGFSFVSGQCVVTPRTGAQRTVTLPNAQGAGVTGVAPGDTVNCTITNKPSSGTLTLQKKVVNAYGGTSVVSDWTLTATGPQTITGKTTAPAVTKAVVTPGSYALSESGGPAGYAASAWSCVGGTLSGSSVTVPADTDVTCTITNSDKPGSVTWTKTAKGNGDLLGGSEWTITGPGFSAPNNVVKDCVVAPCTGPDKDARPGVFRLDGLPLGTYTATETRAPAGYIAAGSFTFTVTAANAGTTQDLGAQVNEQQPGVVVPLTGGMGSDMFLLGGGAILFIALTLFGIHRLRRTRTS